MFVGREDELNKLNQMYQSNQFEMGIIYGRRRIGKTHLINEFIKDKKAIYYTAYEASVQENRESLAKEVWKFEGEDVLTGIMITSFEPIFNKIAEYAKNEPIVFIIDEYPYLAEIYPSISSLLQKYIDREFKSLPNLMIVLSGSSLSFMEEQVLSYKSPLFGRRTAQFKLKPFSIWETKHMLEEYTSHEIFLIHSISGGIPLYIELLSQYETVKEAIISQFLTENGYLFQEHRLLLTQELREPARYNSIIRAIAEGATDRNEISQQSGIEYNQCGQYLNNLMSLDIVERETPLFSKKGRKSLYIIKDSYFRYWYQLVPKNRSDISRGRTERVWKKSEAIIARELGTDFERLAKEWCYKNEQELPFSFDEIGRWWIGNPETKSQEEIDLIAVQGAKALFIECKYRQTVDVDKVYEDLKRKSKLFSKYSERHYLLFTKNKEPQKNKQYRVMSLEELM